MHGNRYLLQSKHDRCAKATCAEMDEQGHDLGIDIRFESEGSHVSKWNDCGREQQVEQPRALIVFPKGAREYDNEQYRHICHDDVEDEV